MVLRSNFNRRYGRGRLGVGVPNALEPVIVPKALELAPKALGAGVPKALDPVVVLKALELVPKAPEPVGAEKPPMEAEPEGAPKTVLLALEPKGLAVVLTCAKAAPAEEAMIIVAIKNLNIGIHVYFLSSK
jgi:hypothetical protein